MIALTEAQARDKRCCGPEGCGGPRRLDDQPVFVGRFCIGSACMAWRWQKPPGEMAWRAGGGGEGFVFAEYLEKTMGIKDVPTETGMATFGFDYKVKRTADKATGHCGLIGP